MATQAGKAINSALTLLAQARNQQNGGESKPSTVGVLPTAKTRSALDLLTQSTMETLVSNEVNLRELAQSLFNWSEKPKATKNVMKALNDALQTPGKYNHAVELTAYVTALVPLLEPDRLARMFSAITEVETSFAPARYTLQLSAKLDQLLSRYPEERREKIAYSLWVEAHQGRWWDLTAGQPVNRVEQGEAVADTVSNKEFLSLLLDRKLPWTPANAERVSKLQPNSSIVEMLDAYNSDLLNGKIVDPDVAVLVSHLPWLTPDQRPESPIGNLLDTLHNLVTTLEYELPEKPKKFSEMFPNIRMYGGATFPFPNSILTRDGLMLDRNVRLELVSNATQLAANREEMGNCTWSYKGRMEKGEYVLFRVHHAGHVYNGSLTLQGTNRTWRLGELNSRFNRGGVPATLRATFENFIRQLPPVETDNEMLRQIEQYKQMQRLKTHKYRYKLS